MGAPGGSWLYSGHTTALLPECNRCHVRRLQPHGRSCVDGATEISARLGRSVARHSCPVKADVPIVLSSVNQSAAPGNLQSVAQRRPDSAPNPRITRRTLGGSPVPSPAPAGWEAAPVPTLLHTTYFCTPGVSPEPTSSQLMAMAQY